MSNEQEFEVTVVCEIKVVTRGTSKYDAKRKAKDRVTNALRITAPHLNNHATHTQCIGCEVVQCETRMVVQ